MFGMELSISNIIQFVGIGIAFVVQWVTLKGRSENNTLKIESADKQISTLKDEMIQMQLTMARDYAPKTMIAEVETRILDRMTENFKNLTDEIRELRKILMER